MALLYLPISSDSAIQLAGFGCQGCDGRFLARSVCDLVGPDVLQELSKSLRELEVLDPVVATTVAKYTP